MVTLWRRIGGENRGFVRVVLAVGHGTLGVSAWVEVAGAGVL